MSQEWRLCLKADVLATRASSRAVPATWDPFSQPRPDAVSGWSRRCFSITSTTQEDRGPCGGECSLTIAFLPWETRTPSLIVQSIRLGICRTIRRTPAGRDERDFISHDGQRTDSARLFKLQASNDTLGRQGVPQLLRAFSMTINHGSISKRSKRECYAPCNPTLLDYF